MDSVTLILSASALASVVVVTLASLRGWQGWLAFKAQELELHRTPGSHAEIEGGAGAGAARIELADLKERIRRLEAIAAGVDL